MTARVVSILEEYRLARLKFSQKLLEQISRTSNISELKSLGLLAILKPLVQDNCSPIKNNAVLIISTCIHGDKSWIGNVLKSGLLNILLGEMTISNGTYKKSVLCILKMVISHNLAICKKVLTPAVYDMLSNGLYDQDTEVREYAGLVLASAARNDVEIATDIVDRSFGPHLITMLQDSKLSLKRSATAVFYELMNQSEDIANTFAVNPVLDLFKLNLTFADKVLISRTLDAFAAIAKHSEILAEKILVLNAYPKCLEFFESRYPKSVKLSAAILAREMVKHNFDLARAFLYFGGVGALLEAIRVETSTCIAAISFITDENDADKPFGICDELFAENGDNIGQKRQSTSMKLSTGNADKLAANNDEKLVVNNGEKLGGAVRFTDNQTVAQNKSKNKSNSLSSSPQKITCTEDDKRLSEKYMVALIASIGFISGHGNELAACVIKSGGVNTLLTVLWNVSPTSNIVEICIWALGQILKSARAQVDQNEITKFLLHLLKNKETSCEVRDRCQVTLKNCIAVCQDLYLLENLLLNAPEFELSEELLADVLVQLEKILSCKPSARRQFVSIGCLKLIRSLSPEPGSNLFEACRQVTDCFPEEIVAYFTPGYEEMLVERWLCSNIDLVQSVPSSKGSIERGTEQRKYTSMVKMEGAEGVPKN